MQDNNISKIISRYHQKIHEGIAFEAFDYDSSVSVNDHIDLFFTGGSLPAHFSQLISSDGDTLVRVYEDPTENVAGTNFTPINLNRKSSTVSTWTCRFGSTFSALGTLIRQIFSPGWSGGFLRGVDLMERVGTEIIFDENKSYLLRITNVASSTQPMHLLAGWYEEELS